MADYIHLKNETNGPVAWNILSMRNKKWSDNSFEPLVDHLFTLLENRLIDKHDQILSSIGSRVIPESQHIRQETATWLNLLGGQSMFSTVSVLSLKSGLYASWTSDNNQSWILREDRIFPAVMGTIDQVNINMKAINWNNVSLSGEAQDKIKRIVEKLNKTSC